MFGGSEKGPSDGSRSQVSPGEPGDGPIRADENHTAARELADKYAVVGNHVEDGAYGTAANNTVKMGSRSALAGLC